MKTLKYKSIIVGEYDEYNLLELNLSNNHIFNSEDFILKVTDFIELAGFKTPDYVVFNKRARDFEIKKSLHKFAHQQIIDSLFDFGVKKVFFVVTDERYLLYKEQISRKNIFPFKSMDEIFSYLKK